MREQNPNYAPRDHVLQVVDLRHLRRYDAAALLDSFRLDNAILNRRELTKSFRKGNQHYVCGKCGAPVFMAANAVRHGSLSAGFHFRHFSGAPETCPWYRRTARPDDVSAAVFHGQQEGPLHRQMKTTVEALLRLDPAVSDVAVQTYVPGDETHGRFPDVRARRGERQHVFEIQLATIQVPTLESRTEFYQRKDMFLHWVFWEFEPHGKLPISVRDTYVPMRKNAFSLDAAAIEEGRAKQQLVLRAYWQLPQQGPNGSILEPWTSRLVTLDELIYPEDKLPYLVDVPHLRRRVYAMSDESRREMFAWWRKNAGHAEFGTLKLVNAMRRVAVRANLQVDDAKVEQQILGLGELEATVSCLLSLEIDEVVGSRYRQVIETINRALGPTQPTPLWPAILSAIRSSSTRESLTVPWVQTRLERSRQAFPQPLSVARESLMLLSAIFPDLEILDLAAAPIGVAEPADEVG